MSFVKIDNSSEINRFIRTVKRSGKPVSSSSYYVEITPPDYMGRFACTNYYNRKCRRNVNSPPLIDLNGAGDGVDHTGSFAGGLTYDFFLEDATILDEDDTEIGSLTVAFGGLWGADGASESIRFGSLVIYSDADLTGIIEVGSTLFSLEYISSTGVLYITNSEATTFPITDGESLIRLFEYRNSSFTPTVGDRTFSWVASNTGVAVEAILDHLDQPILDESDSPIYA